MLTESSPYTNIVSDTMVDSDGAYVRLIESTSRAYKWMCVSIATTQQSITGLLDLSVGGAGSEVNFMDDRMLGVRAGPFGRKSAHLFYFPVDIASGVEIRARIQDDNASGITWRMKVMFSDVGPPAGTPTLMDSTDVRVLVNSSTADVYGSYVNLITSTAHDAKWLLIGQGRGGGASNADTEFSIGLGNPPTGVDEIDEFGLIGYNDGGGGQANTSRSLLIPCDFPAGSQLQARVKDSNNATLGYWFSVQVLG